MEKRIELCKVRAGDIKTGFGNPRKIKKAKFEELARSFEMFGDFGIFLIDEENNVIGGNQRLKVVLRTNGPDTMIDCKRLIGYSKEELRAINIKDNTHEGEWDLDLLSDWTADLNVSFGIDPKEQNVNEREIKKMELIRYEKYDYVLLVCKNEPDYLQLCRDLGIDDAFCFIGKGRKIKARAIWYDDIKAQIVKKDTAKANYDV